MKKIFAVMIGMGLLMGSVSVSFAQDSTQKPAKKAKKSKKSKSTSDTTKK